MAGGGAHRQQKRNDSSGITSRHPLTGFSPYSTEFYRVFTENHPFQRVFNGVPILSLVDFSRGGSKESERCEASSQWRHARNCRASRESWNVTLDPWGQLGVTEVASFLGSPAYVIRGAVLFFCVCVRVCVCVCVCVPVHPSLEMLSPRFNCFEILEVSIGSWDWSPRFKESKIKWANQRRSSGHLNKKIEFHPIGKQ